MSNFHPGVDQPSCLRAQTRRPSWSWKTTPSSGEVLGRILTQDGHVVRHALHPADTLNLIKDWTPRLILLDACLRDGSGLKLAEEFAFALSRAAELFC